MLSPDLCRGGPRHGYPSSTSGKREGEPQGGRRENQLSPNSWPLSEPGPRTEGDCWCRVGVVSAESRNVRPPPPKKKKKKASKVQGALAPPPPYEKVQNIITKWGAQRGP